MKARRAWLIAVSVVGVLYAIAEIYHAFRPIDKRAPWYIILAALFIASLIAETVVQINR